MAWFDILGGVGQGIEQASKTGLLLAQQKKEEARLLREEERLKKADALRDAQEQRLKAQAERQALEEAREDASLLYEQSAIGEQIPLTDPRAQAFIKHYKHGVGTGPAGFITVIQTPERKAKEQARDLSDKTYETSVRKFGEEKANQLDANDFLRQLTQLEGNTPQLNKFLESQSPYRRARVASITGLSVDAFTTDAERAKASRTTAGYQTAMAQMAASQTATQRAALDLEAKHALALALAEQKGEQGRAGIAARIYAAALNAGATPAMAQRQADEVTASAYGDAPAAGVRRYDPVTGKVR